MSIEGPVPRSPLIDRALSVGGVHEGGEAFPVVSTGSWGRPPPQRGSWLDHVAERGLIMARAPECLWEGQEVQLSICPVALARSQACAASSARYMSTRVAPVYSSPHGIVYLNDKLESSPRLCRLFRSVTPAAANSGGAAGPHDQSEGLTWQMMIAVSQEWMLRARTGLQHPHRGAPSSGGQGDILPLSRLPASSRSPPRAIPDEPCHQVEPP